jgi:PAS domain S-box-containing protein
MPGSVLCPDNAMRHSTWVNFPTAATWMIVALVCGYLAVDLGIARHHAERQAEELATSYVRLVEEHASSVFDRANLLLGQAVTLATAEDMTNARKLSAARRNALQEGLTALQREYRGIVSMTLTDADGYAFANTVGVAPGSSLGDRDYFRRLRRQDSDAPVISEVIYGRLSRRWGVQMARRIRGSDGHFAGMVVANLGLNENFSGFYATLTLPNDGLILLKDLEHRVMVRWPVEEEIYGRTLPSQEVSDRLAHNITEAVYPSLSPLDGKKRLLAFRKLANYPYYVIIGLAEADYLANWRAALIRAAVVSILTIIGAAVGTGLLRRKRAVDQALAVAEENARALLNATTDAAALCDLDGNLLRVNTVLTERLGRAAQEMVGANLWEMFPPEVAEPRRQAVAVAVAAGEPMTFQDGRLGRYYLNSVHPVKDSRGHVNRFAIYSRDITAQVEAEERLRTSLREVERSNADLEQFAYIASHDLREPLRMVASYVSLLGRRYADRLDGDARDFIAFAADGARRLDRLVLDLLDYSRLRRWGEDMEPTAAGDALAIALENLQTVIAEISAEVTVAPMPQVIADATQLTRLFQNLIANALKYRSPERSPEVYVDAERHGEEWVFSVRDNGIGIEAEYHERIFRIFQRLHTRDKYEGTGIGLAICRSIVERHGGRIWVESVPGAGTTFRFTLKAAG